MVWYNLISQRSLEITSRDRLLQAQCICSPFFDYFGLRSPPCGPAAYSEVGRFACRSCTVSAKPVLDNLDIQGYLRTILNVSRHMFRQANQGLCTFRRVSQAVLQTRLLIFAACYRRLHFQLACRHVYSDNNS